MVNAPSNGFSPVWREALDELGITPFVGNGLDAQIKEIFGQNDLTPASAAEELRPIVEQVRQTEDALNQANSSLGFFDIEAEELAPGDFEVGFIIPRRAVDNELGELGREFQRLKRILGPFQEIATGTREDVVVRSIGSSDFSAFLDSAPTVALMISAAVERLIAAYANVLAIRESTQRLREAKVPEEALASVKQQADSTMTDEIVQIRDELMEQADDLDDGRRNEVSTDLQHALNALANRIDRGFSIEIRVGEIPAPEFEEEEESADSRELREVADVVKSRQEALKFTNFSGEPILGLEESTGTEDNQGEAA